MSAPQPPADDAPTPESGHAPASGTDAHRDAAPTSYEFHGEKLDFDPYRFGAPEPGAAGGAPPPPSAPGAGGSGPPPTPGERWSPGGDGPDVRPGDYWQGGGAPPRNDAVFPPAGYAPPRDAGQPPVDLGKAPSPDAAGPSPDPHQWAPPAGSAYPPPDARPPSLPGYPAPGGYPTPPRDPQQARGGNGLAVAGMVVGIVGLVLSFTSWPGIVVGLVGLGLSIGGLARARRGAPMRGLAITGIICSVVAVVIGSIILVVYLQRIDFDCVRNAGDNFGQAQECVK